MKEQEIVKELETIAASLYRVRLPVEEAGAYSEVLTCANQIKKLARTMKEEKTDDTDNQPE